MDSLHGPNLVRTLRDLFWFLVIISLPMIALLCASAFGRELYPGQYAQVSPGEREWYGSQKVPGTNSLCCSISDGSEAEEDIRGGDYWVRWPAHPEWMKVPPEAIIDKNHQGNPVVWWTYDEENNTTYIRCYARGTGV